MNTAVTPSAKSRMPVIFLAHGSPVLLDDTSWVAELNRWAVTLPTPRAILIVSAHWTDSPMTLSATRSVPLVYDFYGFPKRYYDVQYAAPGAPELAARLERLLGALGPVRTSERGLDHGAYIPLKAMYPAANIPVLQLSMPSLSPKPLFELGRAVAALREEGVLILGSGFLTHNLRAVDFSSASAPPRWATEFDAWSADVLARGDIDALLDYRARAPGVAQSLPTDEHFSPVVLAAGAAAMWGEVPAFPITGFAYGSMTRRSVQWG